MYVCIFKIYRSAKTTAQKHTPHTFVSDIFTTTHLAPPTSGSRNPNNCTTIVLVTKAHKALVLTDIEHCAYTTRTLSEPATVLQQWSRGDKPRFAGDGDVDA